MRQIGFIVFFIMLTITGYGQRKLKKLEVKEEGFDIKLNFQPIADRMTYQGLSIMITPISTDELNSSLLEESFYNGKFNYSYFKRSRQSYFLKKKRGKREKSDEEFFHEGISWLEENDKIDLLEYDELEKNIIYYFDEKYAKEYYSNSQLTSGNPYFSNDKYLNVFKIKISNPTSTHITIDKDLVIENGNVLLNQMSSDILIKQLDSLDLLNQNKLMALERHHFKKGIIIPPKSEVIKFIAIPPLNYNNQELNISINGYENKLSWKIIKSEIKIDKLYNFYELKLDWKSDYDIKFCLLKGDENSIFMNQNKLFIGEENLNSTFEIFTISLDRNTLSYGRSPKLKGSDFIDKEKNRRKIIDLELQKIDELKKKVKE